MNLTRYNPNNDRGITTQANVSGLRCFDGEDLCKSQPPHQFDHSHALPMGV